MENVRKLLPLIIGFVVAVFVFFLSRKLRQSNQVVEERNTILERAREAKMAKSILKKSENEESTTNFES
jgi:hypothetical protein